MAKPKKTTAPPSSKRLARQKSLKKRRSQSAPNPRKRRKLEHNAHTATTTALASPEPSIPTTSLGGTSHGHNDGECSVTSSSLKSLRDMVTGKQEYTTSQRSLGQYLALDCEMVGIGIDGAESSLARVSLVNWYGAVQLDEFVRQRERVVDYRTRWSGIRESDLVGAKPFAEVQQRVADMLKDRILIGHAVHNDLKALLLSHPHPSTRDTQIYARKFNVTKSKHVALRTLVKEQLGLSIQEGEHNSVIDARATMAIYRLFKKEWEKATPSRKRKHDAMEEKGKAKQSNGQHQDDGEDESNAKVKGKSKEPKSGRKRVSSGLSTVTKRHGPDDKTKKAWWSELPTSSTLARK